MASVVISGGTKGIGLSLVNQFAQAGFNIAVCSRKESDLNDLRNRLTKTFPNIKVYTYACDASIKEEIIAFGQFAMKHLDNIDVLINNVGIFIPGSIGEEEDFVFEKIWNTNVSSAYHLSRCLLPIMKEKRAGYIFNMCSTASIVPYANGGSYCVSKFALLGFSKVLREELKPFGIRVSSIIPGATDTASWEGSGISKERFINPDEVARLIFEFYKTPQNVNVEEIIIRPILGDIV